MVAVAEVQLGQRGHVTYDEAQRRVGDVQACQAQVLHVAQLTPVVQLTYKREIIRGVENELEDVCLTI